MKIGYARVSTDAQSMDRQIAVLRTEGVKTIFREKASGRSMHSRPQLERAIDALGENDVLVIAEWDRATRSMMDGISIISRVAERRSLVKVMDKPWLDLTTPMGKGILALLSAMAEDERERILKRANEGREIARSKGVRFGRRPKLTDHQRKQALARLTAGDNQSEIAADYNVHRSTISRLR